MPSKVTPVVGVNHIPTTVFATTEASTGSPPISAPNHLPAAMAKFIRSAKSGSDWTDAELLAYNISIIPTSPAVFFQSSTEPSLDHLDPAILTSPINADDPNLSNATADYLGYLDLATNATQETAIDDFAAATLRLLGFNDRHSTVATRYIIPLTICGESRTAQIDVCVVYRPSPPSYSCLLRTRLSLTGPALRHRWLQRQFQRFNITTRNVQPGANLS